MTLHDLQASMKLLFKKKPREEDFSAFLGDAQIPTNKDALLKQCLQHDVSPYIDEASETSSGIYAQLRGVASAAELERRLNAKNTLGVASRANRIAFLAFLISIATLVKEIVVVLKQGS